MTHLPWPSKVRAGYQVIVTHLFSKLSFFTFLNWDFSSELLASFDENISSEVAYTTFQCLWVLKNMLFEDKKINVRGVIRQKKEK